MTLSSLSKGETARIESIGQEITGLQRRRLLDLGLIPGTEIKNSFSSPAGGASAYEIQGSVIALRHEQTDHISISLRKD